MRGAALVALVALGCAAPAARAAAPIWHLAQPDPPAGAPFKVPLGPPGDLVFWSRNRGLLGVEGNAVVPRGIYSWDGRTWHELATVCGSSGDTMRIAFAGPDEFWTVSEPSQPRVGSGTALCHFVNGQVVGSFSTAPEAPDPYHTMDAAACNGPDDCWFGGYGAQDPTGDRVGAFHLHWDGHSLTTVYAPQGRGVSALAFHGGTFFETTFDGRAPEDTSDPVALAAPETKPALIHRISGGRFSNDPWTPPALAGAPADGADMLALGADATDLWAVGGGAASGPDAPDGDVVPRPPLAARLVGDAFASVPVDGTAFGPTDRFVSVSPAPGSTQAWVAVQRFADRRSTNAKATVALLGADGHATVTRLPVSGAGRGAAARIAFTDPNDGWLVTTAGWLFHYTDGTEPDRDTDPSYQGTITFRPNEAQAQATPDAPPPDDSQLFAPPPPPVQPTAPPATTKRLSAAVKNVRSRLRGLTLVVSFKVVRKAKIGLTAKRHGRVVAQAKPRSMKPGNRSISLRLNRQRWPTALSFQITEPGQSNGGGGGTGVITTQWVGPHAR
ncbi:MAG: hypothetical protein JWN32_4233 [Solirubrobacterales bacterium]|nr:hypothetical protein [Solirubrobacterales bacterium]